MEEKELTTSECEDLETVEVDCDLDTEVTELESFDEEETSEEEEATENKWALRDRLKSKVLWASAIGEIVVIINSIHEIVECGWDGNEIQAMLVALLGLLSLFGIFNDPTSKDTF